MVVLSAPFASAQDARTTVRLDGRALFRVGPVPDRDAAMRATEIERRLTSLLQNPRAIAPSTVNPAGADGSEREIAVAGVPIVTVTRDDARDNLMTADALAVQWAQAIDEALRRASERRTSPWGRFTIEVQGSVTTAFARLLDSAITVIPRAIAALLVLGLFWAIAGAMRRAMRLLFRRVVDDLTVENLIKQVAYYAVWGLGLLLAADALGFTPQTVVTGLGLTGLALGFALKDIISNFVSGLLILALRPFRLGDEIVVGETEGSVERIDLRATQIRTYDGRLVLVPNQELFTSRVVNNTASPVRRGSVEIFVGYDADLRRVARVVLAAIGETGGVIAEPPPSARVRELGPNDVVVEARYWTDSRRSDFVATASSVRESIVEALRRAGIGLPDPSVRFLAPRRAREWRIALGVDDGRPDAGHEGARRDTADPGRPWSQSAGD